MVSGNTYRFSTELLNHHAYDTRGPKELYMNIQTYRANGQEHTLKMLRTANSGDRHRFFWTNIFLDNFVIETALISPLHEYRHAEIARHYGASNISVNYFSTDFDDTGLSNPELAHIYGTGINFQTELARSTLMTSLLSKQPLLFTQSVYLSNKMTGLIYGGLLRFGDPANYIDNLKDRQGISITQNDLSAYYIVSTLLSGGILSYFRDVHAFLSHGTTDTPPISAKMLGGTVIWPEFSIFMNPSNVSLLAESVYYPDGDESLSIIFGIEYVLKGTSASNEYDIGFYKTFEKVSIFSQLTLNDDANYFLDSTIKYKISDTLNIFTTYQVGDNGTQRQERRWIFSKDILGVGVEYIF